MTAPVDPGPDPGPPSRAASATRVDRAQPGHQRGAADRHVYALSAAGVGDVAALLLSGLWPVLEVAITVRRTRRVDELSVFVLLGLAVGVATAAVSDDRRSLFYKDSVTTGLVGAVFLASLAGPRPLTFYFGRRFAADDTDEGRTWWDGLWQYPGFRRVQRQLTIMWGAGLLGEAAVRALLTRQLGVDSMVAANNIVPYLVISALIRVSVLIGRRHGQRHIDDADDPTG